MTIYRAAYYSHRDGSEGYSFHASKEEAKEKVKRFKSLTGTDFDHTDIEVIHVIPTKPNIISCLNNYASHNNNG